MTTQTRLSPDMPPARVAETPLAPQPPVLVLFGRDSSGRPRAAWFDAGDGEAAAAAAATMRLRALPLTDDAGRDIARQLARGRLLASGRALVPFTKRNLYAGLVALAGEEAGLAVAVAGPIEPAPDDKSSINAPVAAVGAMPAVQASLTLHTGDAASPPTVVSVPAKQSANPRPNDRAFLGSPHPSEREQIGLGSIVLAHEGADEGWWEAEVIGINGRVFSLRWRDYPSQPTILRKASELALLPPGEA